ncbi:hypothetical protein, partial [Clostridium perfringens]|uniref:hypothetical protein n=1 Tax=Clostridium perfringens TaxID=1502 RepID=UPI002ACBFB6C
NHTVDEIHHIRINNILVIEKFITKAIKENNIVIEYAVLKSDIQTEITKVEIMDIDNKVLTTINVYVPVIEDLELKHILKIDEGVV